MMGSQAPLQWGNNEATLYGSDLYLSKVFNTQWHFTLSAQWVKGELDQAITGETISLYRVSPFSGHAAIHYSQNDFDMSVNLTAAASQTDVSSLQNETPTSGYGVLGVNANYHLSNNLRLSLIIENLFDKEYVQHLGGVNRVSGSDVAVGEKVPEIGRNVGVYINYAF
jgi:iron complex outermembrane receptor protein